MSTAKARAGNIGAHHSVTETATMLKGWLRERRGGPDDPLFPSIRGGKLSRDAVERIVTKYTAIARKTCARLNARKSVPTCCGTPQPWTFSKMESTAR